MTQSLAVSSTTSNPPSPGTIVYLASYVLQMALNAQVTPPDTPSMYSADLEVQGDQGDMDLTSLEGPQGFSGAAQFGLRRQTTPIVNTIYDLPRDLLDVAGDYGKYWVIDTIENGVVVEEKCHVWWGSGYREAGTTNGYKIIQMGTVGAPGAVPDISLDADLLPPQLPNPYPDTTSWVETGGSRLEPTWRVHCSVRPGIPGPATALAVMPDVDLNPADTGSLTYGDLFAATGHVDGYGRMIWGPLSPSLYASQFLSVPQSAFSGYNGFNQRAVICNYVIPAMPFPYTPIIWGHLGSGGIHLSADPLMIGVQVWLGNHQTGTLIGRGMGNAGGEVNIMPHYSTPSKPAVNISATNQTAVVPAGQTQNIEIDLWNDGALGVYLFNPTNAQAFILIQPMERDYVFAPFDPTS